MHAKEKEVIGSATKYLTEAGIYSNYPTTRSGLNLVLLFPGIRNYDVWTSILKKELSKIDDVRAEIVGISEFSLGQFFFDVIFDAHDRHLHIINERVVALIAKHEPSAILLIGHSYGTFIMSRFLEAYRNYAISGIILAGSILPVDFMWRRADTSIEVIVNECGRGDYFPVLAGMLSKRFGASGRIGFSDDRATNRWHPYKTHAHFLYFSQMVEVERATISGCIDKYIKPILLEGLVLEDQGVFSPLTAIEKVARVALWPTLLLPRFLSRITRAMILILFGRYFRTNIS
jgi:hypothetical protein